MKFSILATTAAVLVAGLSAQSLTSGPGFASNNGGGNNGAVYFDLIGGPADLSVHSLDLNLSNTAGTSVGINVYVRNGTFAGNEGDPNGWNMFTSDIGGVVAAGRDMPTSFVLQNPICINAGATVGIAIQGVGAGHAYTNGDGTNEIVSNADLTLSGGSAMNPLFTGTLFSPRIVNTTVNYTLGSCQLVIPPGRPGLVGVAEATPGSGTLAATGGSFEDGWDLRWNFVDPNSSGYYAGAFSVVTMKVELGGPVPDAMSPQIPGFVQAWTMSTPMGPDPLFFGPYAIGDPDGSVNVPVGLFNLTDSVRIQGLVFDPVWAPGSLPVIPTNTVEWSFFRPFTCTVLEDFESVATGLNLPAGWMDGGGTQMWRAQSGSTVSSNTGPSGAQSGSIYMYAETSGSGGTGTFIMDSAPVASGTLPTGTLNFYLSRIGASIGSLDVQMDDGTGNFVTLQNFTGPSGSGQDWDPVSIDLLSASGLGALPANIIIRFSYTGGGTFTGDLGIDDFCLN